MGSRFNEEVLSNPKSFTRRNFSNLHHRHNETLAVLRSATPQLSEPSSPDSDELHQGRPGSSSQHPEFEPLPPPHNGHLPRQSSQSSQVKYWNEYDDGSEGGGPEDDYAIYINPDDRSTFPGLGYVNAILTLPFEKVKHWFHLRPNPEQEPLLGESSSRPPTQGYTSTALDSDEEGYASSGDFPARGYTAHYAFPSIGDQKVVRYRENVLFWATTACFITSFALLAISGVLISAGRHKLRVEVDAAVTVGVAMSLFSACSGLGMTLYRRDPLSIPYRLMVGSTFVAACLLNGMLLILVVGNTP